jgi:FkbM family methyltransferase
LPQLWDNSLQREVFVDCGCFDGNNSIEFKNWCCNNNREGYVYAFEPDPINIMNIENKLNEEDVKHTVIAKGVWNEKDILKFNCGGVGSCIDKDGKIEIEVDSIDNIVKSEVTFIKMDIEGAEYKAIQGARKTIEKYHPKLAVCVYHKPEDIWELPLLIHEVNPEYKMFLRHYSFAANETVLYAI